MHSCAHVIITTINFRAIGHYTHAHEHKEAVCDMLRRTAERCDSLHGFLVLFSLGGGTGSGLGTALVKLLEDEFPLVDRLAPNEHCKLI